jgi:hypothetical protein
MVHITMTEHYGMTLTVNADKAVVIKVRTDSLPRCVLAGTSDELGAKERQAAWLAT